MVAQSLKSISKVSPIYTLLVEMAKQISTKQDADKAYRGLVPVIKQMIEDGAKLNSSNLSGLVELLSELPPYGARRLHFEKRYLHSENTILMLPDNPDELAYGFWW